MAGVSLNTRFFLEVVRGKDAGRRYALNGRSVLLGNAVGAGQGIDLADQEGNAPRKMAARQASIEASGESLLLRDLDSPGGTFVNRQRVLSGQAKPLQVGDVIQLGGVQLKIVGGEPATTVQSSPAPPISREKPPPKPFAITLKSGASARSWDDLLTISSQRWAELRDELTSGRLAGSLATIGLGEYSPNASEAGSPDDRLDAWLGRLPTTKPATPELDIHPARLALKANPGGGTLFAKVRVENVGYRLLRFTVRIDPAGAPWLKLAPGVGSGPMATAEGVDVGLELAIPEIFTTQLRASLVVDSNGGTRSIPISLEAAPAAGAAIPSGPSPISGSSIGLTEWLAARSLSSRIIAGALIGSIGRGLLAVSTGIAGMFGIGVSGGSPSLAGSGLAMAAIGAFLGWGYATRKKAWSDLIYAGIAGGIGGLLAATVAVAAIRSVEPPGTFLGSVPIPLKAVLWGLIGAAVAAVSMVVVPHRRQRGRTP